MEYRSDYEKLVIEYNNLKQKYNNLKYQHHLLDSKFKTLENSNKKLLFELNEYKLLLYHKIENLKVGDSNG